MGEQTLSSVLSEFGLAQTLLMRAGVPLSHDRILARRAANDDAFAGLSAEQVAAWEELDRHYEAVRPFRDHLPAFSRVVSLSLREGASSSVPIARTRFLRHLYVSGINDRVSGDQNVALLQAPCPSVSRVRVGRTLRETLGVARSDAARELRLQMGAWGHPGRTHDPAAAAAAGRRMAEARRRFPRTVRADLDGAYTLWFEARVPGTAQRIDPHAHPALSLAWAGSMRVAPESAARMDAWTLLTVMDAS